MNYDLKFRGVMILFTVIAALILVWFTSCEVEAQYDKISHDTRSLELGASGIDDTASLNATVILPVAGERFTG